MSSAELIKLLIAGGWVKARQDGSHITLTKPGVAKIITIPKKRFIKRCHPAGTKYFKAEITMITGITGAVISPFICKAHYQIKR
ncbi:type II toxin-antitoxin system HicA family toxin [Photorhabdus asymbiotica]|uniref:type II toxin-antitoxin system HicA family toxin n=1 Tax=Photorhabdus asymbiotica TaxID=291112 RepID=UPI003DA7A3E7